MNEVGDVLMTLGFVLMGIGAVGLTVIGIIMAFGVTAPLGFLAIMVSGLLWGMVGTMFADA